MRERLGVSPCATECVKEREREREREIVVSCVFTAKHIAQYLHITCPKSREHIFLYRFICLYHVVEFVTLYCVRKCARRRRRGRVHLQSAQISFTSVLIILPQEKSFSSVFIQHLSYIIYYNTEALHKHCLIYCC